MRTVGIDLSIQLKNAGYPQVGLFMWDMDSKLRVGIGTAQAPHYKTAFPDVLEVEVDSCITAPTVDEMLDSLPQNLKDEEYGELTYMVYLSINGWNIDYTDIEGMPFYDQNALTLADAAAKMWLYLKKEGLL